VKDNNGRPGVREKCVLSGWVQPSSGRQSLNTLRRTKSIYCDLDGNIGNAAKNPLAKARHNHTLPTSSRLESLRCAFQLVTCLTHAGAPNFLRLAQSFDNESTLQKMPPVYVRAPAIQGGLGTRRGFNILSSLLTFCDVPRISVERYSIKLKEKGENT